MSVETWLKGKVSVSGLLAVVGMAVLAILITAPLGAAGMDLTYDKLLVHSED